LEGRREARDIVSIPDARDESKGGVRKVTSMWKLALTSIRTRTRAGRKEEKDIEREK